LTGPHHTIKRSALAVQKQTAEAQKQIDAQLDRIVQSDSPTVIKANEKKIVTLETGKILLEENQEKPARSTRDFDVALEHTNHPSHPRLYPALYIFCGIMVGRERLELPTSSV